MNCWTSTRDCLASNLSVRSATRQRRQSIATVSRRRRQRFAGGEELRNLGGAPLGKVDAISFANNTVDIKKRQDTADLHPQAVFAHTYVGGQVMADALVRIGEYVADHGLRGDGPYLAARDLLLTERPRVSGEPLRGQGETTVESAVR
jgi:hypothetical protein